MNPSTLTMESLALPNDLYWDGKLEPISPPSSELFSIPEFSDNWLLACNFANGLPSLLDDEEILENKNVPHELTNGDDVVMELRHLKEECLLDTKILDYPIGIDVVQSHTVTKVQTPISSAVYNQSGFDTAVLAQLTPPQSPPRNSAASSPVYQQNNLFIESPNTFNGIIAGISPAPQSPSLPPSPPAIAISPTAFLNTSSAQAENIPNAVPNNFNFNWPESQEQQVIGVSNGSPNLTAPSVNNNEDFERDMKLLDEIVNTRAKELPEWNALEESETQSSFSAPSQAGSTTSDDDWQPESSCSSNISSPHYQHSGDENHSYAPQASLASLAVNPLQSGTCSNSTSNNKRARPYSRGSEDRKIRKKEQNKNAATRYRQKKKQEMENILVEELELLQRNTELKRILADAKREAKYLKSLIMEFYQIDGKSA